MCTLTKIIELLGEKKLSQKDLTDYLGISKNTFTNWKSGLSNSYIKHISKIAEFFGVSTDYLLGNEQNENSPPKSELSLKVLQEIEDCSETEAEFILNQIKAIKALRNK